MFTFIFSQQPLRTTHLIFDSLVSQQKYFQSQEVQFSWHHLLICFCLYEAFRLKFQLQTKGFKSNCWIKILRLSLSSTLCKEKKNTANSIFEHLFWNRRKVKVSRPRFLLLSEFFQEADQLSLSPHVVVVQPVGQVLQLKQM